MRLKPKFPGRCGQNVKDRRVVFGNLPCVVITSLKADAFIAQIFVCVVTRSTTAEFQHNDMMMRSNVQNDLRHEMALDMWIVSVHEKSEQHEQLRETENKACMCIDLYS